MNTMLTNDETNSLLDALKAERDKEIVKMMPGDITRKMLAEKLDISENGARDRLKKLVKLGYFEEIPTKDKTIYRPTEEGKKKYIIGGVT